MLFSTFMPCIAGAVNLPEGVTASQIEEAVPKLGALLKNLLATNPETKDLKKTVYGMLYEDDTINALFSGIYTALGENADAMSIIGVDISPAALSAALSGFPQVSKKIASCSDIAGVIKASSSFKWEVGSKTEFAKALAAMLSPFNELLNALLCAGKVNINALISIQGDDGYSSAIIPLLTALDCPEIMSSSEFAASASKNHSNIIKNIVSMVFSALDRLLDDPVKGLCSTLPKVAYYLDSGMLSSSITALLEPLSLKIAGIFTIPGISDLITGAANLEEGLNINEMLEGIDMSSLLGSDVKLTIPEIDIKKLAECATYSSGYTVDEAAAFTVIMNFLLETVKLNKDSLGALLGGEDISETLDPLLSKSNDEIIKTIVVLFTMTSIPENKYNWFYPAFTATIPDNTPTFTANDYAAFLEKVDPLLTDFVKESDPESDIEKTLRKTIYSNSLVSQLVTGIFSLIGGEEMAPLFALLGMDVTPTGVGNAIYNYYPYTARQLYKYSSWEKVNPAYLTWGFYDGDSEGFTKAVARVLAPFTPLLTCMLAGQNVTLLDSITLPGADGYNTAVIPLLEALGCPSDKIKSYDEYKKGAGTASVVTDILTPVTALLDELCAAPVKTACRILPNIIYFFNSGLMNGVLENLIYPVKYMLDTAGLGDLLSDAMSETANLDLSSLVGELTAGMDLGITLPELDLAVIGTLGTASTLTSKRVSGGAPAQYTYITADAPGVFLTIMRFVVSAISMEENSGLLTGLMGSESAAPSPDGMPDMFSMFAGNIAEKFKGMSNDQIVEWLCDLLFSESPIVELPVEDEEIPSIIYKEKFSLPSWAKIAIPVAVIALAALVYYVLSVSGKLDNYKLKKAKKKEIKRREEESRKLIKGGGTAVAPLENATSVKEKKSKAEKTAKPRTEANENTRSSFTAEPQRMADEVKKTVPEKTYTVFTEKTENGNSVYLDPLAEQIIAKEKENRKEPTEKQLKRLKKAESANSKKDTRIASAKLPDEKQAEKLIRRQKKAQQKAIKNQAKIQKHYEKAKLQAQKKNMKSSKGGNN